MVNGADIHLERSIVFNQEVFKSQMLAKSSWPIYYY